MNADLGITPTQYGLGAGLFFLSYSSMGIPCQILMSYIGGPRWLGTIALGWGIVAACMSLIRTVPAFLAMRCLLGFFESGALPGMWTYLSYFYNKNRITVPLGYLMTALILSQALGAPLAAGLMAMDSLGGLRGWQWLFLIEGLMAVVVASAFFFMPAGVDQVKGLTDDEKEAVHASMAAYKPQAAVGPAMKAALLNPAVWVIGVGKFCRDVAFYGEAACACPSPSVVSLM
jgi:MFS family permease